MVQDVSLALVLASVIIVMGSIGSYIFRRTRIPDMVFLVFLGILLGPFFGLVTLENIVPVAPYVSILALIIILFSGGLNLSIRRVIRETPRATTLAVLAFLMSVTATALFAKHFLAMRWLDAFLLGSIVGGSSSVVVVSLAPKIGVSSECSTVLVLESAITDVLCTIAALTLIGVILSGLPTTEALARQVTTRFSTGGMFGLTLGLIWLFNLPRLKNEPYRYMLTLAVLFLCYTVSEFLGGSGALSVLLFGVVLGNEREILSVAHQTSGITVIDHSFRRLEGEIAFLIRTFFFVYLGLIVSFQNSLLVVYGIMISLVLLAARFVAVRFATVRSSLSEERRVITIVLTRGLAAAVLAVLPQQFGLPRSEVYAPITLTIILATAIITTLGLLKPSYRPRSMYGT